MNIYKREKYLRRLRGFFHDTEMIKVITGVRRCGKSCLMASIAAKNIARSKRRTSLTP